MKLILLIIGFLLLIGTAHGDMSINNSSGWQNTSLDNTSIDLGSGDIVISDKWADDFDDGNDDWTDNILTTNPTSDNSYSSPYSFNGTDGAFASRDVTTTNVLNLNFYYYHNGSNSTRGTTMMISNSSGTEGPRITFNSSGKVQYYTDGYYDIVPYTGQTWTQYLMEANLSSDTFRLYTGGTWYGPCGFRNALTDFGKIQYNNQHADTDSRIDDVRIYESEVVSGNITHWHDAGSGNETYQVVVNATTPTNTNYTVWHCDNGTGSFTQNGGVRTGNDTITLNPIYQDTDVRIVLTGNITKTPELISMTFNTRVGLQPPVVSNTTGEWWINWTWPAVDNATNYEVYVYEN